MFVPPSISFMQHLSTLIFSSLCSSHISLPSLCFSLPPTTITSLSSDINIWSKICLNLYFWICIKCKVFSLVTSSVSSLARPFPFHPWGNLPTESSCLASNRVCCWWRAHLGYKNNIWKTIERKFMKDNWISLTNEMWYALWRITKVQYYDYILKVKTTSYEWPVVH